MCMVFFCVPRALLWCIWGSFVMYRDMNMIFAVLLQTLTVAEKRFMLCWVWYSEWGWCCWNRLKNLVFPMAKACVWEAGRQCFSSHPTRCTHPVVVLLVPRPWLAYLQERCARQLQHYEVVLCWSCFVLNMVFFLAYLGSVVMYMGLFCGVYRALLRRIWGSFAMYMETGLCGAALALDYLPGTYQHGSRSFVMIWGSFVMIWGSFVMCMETGLYWAQWALFSCIWVSCIWRQGSFLIYTGLFCDVYGALL